MPTTGRITEIDVGVPPYAPDGVETFQFNFHRFAFIPALKGNAVPTPPFSCFGHQWQLTLFPGGDEAEGGEVFMSIWLTKLRNGNAAGCSVWFEVSVINHQGDEFRYNHHEGEQMHTFDDANSTRTKSHFVSHSYVISPFTNFLDNGTLVIQLQLRLDRKSDLICRLPRKPFVPNNSCEKKMGALWFQDEKYTDVVFVIPNEKEGAEEVDGAEKGGDEGEGGEEGKQQRQHLPTILEDVDVDEDEEEVDARGEEMEKEADRYGVSDLKLEAEAWYTKFTDITAENALELLHYATAKNLASLKEAVMDYFVKNGSEALRQISFDDIPENRSLFTDLLLSLSVGHARGGEDDDDDYKVMRVGCLRRKLDDLGLDVDGSRETLIKRLTDGEDFEAF